MSRRDCASFSVWHQARGEQPGVLREPEPVRNRESSPRKRLRAPGLDPRNRCTSSVSDADVVGHQHRSARALHPPGDQHYSAQALARPVLGLAPAARCGVLREPEPVRPPREQAGWLAASSRGRLDSRQARVATSRRRAADRMAAAALLRCCASVTMQGSTATVPCGSRWPIATTRRMPPTRRRKWRDRCRHDPTSSMPDWDVPDHHHRNVQALAGHRSSIRLSRPRPRAETD